MSATLTSTVSPRRPGHRDAVIATLVVAFSADPVIRWLFPETRPFLIRFPELLVAMGGAAFDTGTADRLADDAGAALWVAPGSGTDDEALGEVLDRGVDAARQDEVLAFAGRVLEHHPTEPHWYLPFIGVDPRCQGLGLGSRLLQHGLARCDDDGLSAYLEASSPRNRALYERHGFEVLTEVQLGSSPPLWPMLRPAHATSEHAGGRA